MPPITCTNLLPTHRDCHKGGEEPQSSRRSSGRQLTNERGSNPGGHQIPMVRLAAGLFFSSPIVRCCPSLAPRCDASSMMATAASLGR